MPHTAVCASERCVGELLSMCLCARGVRARSVAHPLCCIAARPAHPEVAAVLHRGTHPRSQRVNPPHLHIQPT